MGVAAVDGYGQITAGNAKEIYTAWKRGDVELSVSQQKYTESLLSPEEIDDISYDTDASKKEGSEKINTDGADKKTGGSVAAATALNMGTIAAMGALFYLDGYTAMGASFAVLGLALAQYFIVKLFDNAYDQRTAACDAGDETNATIDGAANALLESMDYMNEDMELYQAQTEEYTLNVNTNTSMMADLQVQLADAQSAGDTAGAENIRNQMKSLEEVDMSGQQEEMDETKGRLEEYSSANAESQGISASGQTVADFLKGGTAMGVMASLNALLDAAAAIVFKTVQNFPKLPFGIDAPASAVANSVKTIAAGGFVAAAALWTNKAVKEFECGSKGGDMEGHVKALNDMIGEQEEYIGTTEESFGATDEESSESQAEAQEAANEAVQSNTGTKSTGGKKEDDKKTEQPSGTA